MGSGLAGTGLMHDVFILGSVAGLLPVWVRGSIQHIPCVPLSDLQILEKVYTGT